MRYFFVCCLWFVVASAFSQPQTDDVGLLIMAHGGSEEWNSAIEEAAFPLRTKFPVSIAFGMANPETLQKAVDELVSQRVKSIAVVRLFVSGESFIDETRYAFGLSSVPPEGHFMHQPRILDLTVPTAISIGGLLDDHSLSGVLVDRASNLSSDPGWESVLIVGHGPGDDDENERWLSKMNILADSVRESANFHIVKVSTLREDWTGKREVVEKELRHFVEMEAAEGRNVIIIPFRLHGFGPYSDVFDGLAYQADSLGFLPDKRVTHWIEQQYRQTKALLISTKPSDQ
jgi:sirohydrochlorin cobaltochelatase